ncbi:methylglyoxal synthase [Halonotius terrestris]|uniref:Methylglyoxal synthase n=1 Tax=Halonotius terrestris TaxID=2487750 RepID=A0A8J8TDQ2_9EURY|nr:methylglyoxal synthase [Halonotius terrestris]TQQ83409.1 methylglyoxal synthase [Halonotius terrestris]
MRLALIAHDEKKDDLIEFAQEYEDWLADAELMATGTTGKRLMEATDLDIERKESGPLGGDMQIGGEIAEKTCDGVIFMRDPLTAQPHEPDVSALLRICDVHDIPLATNLASARFLLEGLFDAAE